MPKKTYTQINSVTLAASSSSVVFSSIPQNFRDLVLVGNGQKSANGAIRIELNGDSGNLSMIQVYGYSGGSGTVVNSTGRMADTSNFGIYNFKTEIMDYSASDKHKNYLSRSGDAGWEVDMFTGRWANTSPVTSLRVFPNDGTFNSGHTFTIYGIEA
jgi:hypothetical protein